jgi:hypothetical protein
VSAEPSKRTRFVGFAITLLISAVSYGLIAYALALTFRWFWGDRAGTIAGLLYGAAVIIGAAISYYRIIVKGEIPRSRRRIGSGVGVRGELRN